MLLEGGNGWRCRAQQSYYVVQSLRRLITQTHGGLATRMFDHRIQTVFFRSVAKFSSLSANFIHADISIPLLIHRTLEIYL